MTRSRLRHAVKSLGIVVSRETFGFVLMERIVPWIGVLSARLDYRTVVFSERSGADIGAGLSTFATRIELPDGVPFRRTPKNHAVAAKKLTIRNRATRNSRAFHCSFTAGGFPVSGLIGSDSAEMHDRRKPT